MFGCFNGLHYLQPQVDSILEQTDVDITLYVSVDRSTDGTEDWFRNLQSREARIVLLPYGETFGGAARNFFRLLREVDFSPFEYVAFADQDDIWLPGKLKRAVDRLVERGRMVIPAILSPFGNPGAPVILRNRTLSSAGIICLNRLAPDVLLC
ncbi:glycosyltransferase [Rhodoferax sp. AJA081-3]|uniref:glycosyltransferase n=1 Tax=Rhodoferax sp. AJA081-3 TaxID=2752316 RepID=UPI001ADF0EAA|nr:glycosyltransferase [Rhodoferax sp. AJA081-3]QTN30413.1 glycosyltransferase [Rhodoferax sp. AJA081-3]